MCYVQQQIELCCSFRPVTRHAGCWKNVDMTFHTPMPSTTVRQDGPRGSGPRAWSHGCTVHFRGTKTSSPKCFIFSAPQVTLSKEHGNCRGLSGLHPAPRAKPEIRSTKRLGLGSSVYSSGSCWALAGSARFGDQRLPVLNSRQVCFYQEAAWALKGKPSLGC